MIRIVIADDHTLFRDGLRKILAGAPDMSVAGEARDGNEVLQRVRGDQFDVLVLDMSMPGKSGIELIKQVRGEKPKLRVLVLSMHAESQYAVRAIRAGAAGYMTKETASDQLIAAIRKVAAGGAFISPAAAEQFALGSMPDHDGPPHTALSDREFQVFQLLVRGISGTDIAGQLHLSVKTISTHKASIMRKMGMANQSELIRYALSYGLLDNPVSSP
jgi:DNA-binding NarL/FixJ family response regulator